MLLDSLLFPTLQVLLPLHLLVSIVIPLLQLYHHLCLRMFSTLHCTLRICAPLPPDTTLGPPALSTCWAAWDAIRHTSGGAALKRPDVRLEASFAAAPFRADARHPLQVSPVLVEGGPAERTFGV